METLASIYRFLRFGHLSVKLLTVCHVRFGLFISCELHFGLFYSYRKSPLSPFPLSNFPDGKPLRQFINRKTIVLK